MKDKNFSFSYFLSIVIDEKTLTENNYIARRTKIGKLLRFASNNIRVRHSIDITGLIILDLMPSLHFDRL